MKVLGGEMLFEKLTKEVDSKEYATGKAVIWMEMLNDYKKPTKWYAPTKKGTRVKFDYFHLQEDYDEGLDGLREYIEVVNNEHGTEFEIRYKV